MFKPEIKHVKKDDVLWLAVLSEGIIQILGT